MTIERIFIVVKTYPVISEKYKELACTAGLREDGSWIRLYPVPFRLLNEDQRYRKYQWIEADIERNLADPRPESYKIRNTEGIKLLEAVDTRNEWRVRRSLVFKTERVFTRKDEIIALAHKNKKSLVIFKPKRIVDFLVEEADANWSEGKVRKVLDQFRQGNLFGDYYVDDFNLMPKLPKKFSFIFEDEAGKRSKLMIEDWEAGQLYWKCLTAYNEEVASEKVRDKYFSDFATTKDLYFFLGTTREWHIRKAPNPYVIVGTFHPPIQKQMSFL